MMKTKTKLKRKIAAKLKLKLKNKSKRKSHCKNVCITASLVKSHSIIHSHRLQWLQPVNLLSNVSSVCIVLLQCLNNGAHFTRELLRGVIHCMSPMAQILGWGFEPPGSRAPWSRCLWKCLQTASAPRFRFRFISIVARTLKITDAFRWIPLRDFHFSDPVGCSPPPTSPQFLVPLHIVIKREPTCSQTARRGIISGTNVTFYHNSGNFCPNLMILSALWTEIIYVQARTKICHRTLIVLLHYLAKIKCIRNYQTRWLLLHKLSTVKIEEI